VDGTARRPLTPAEAKEALREAARDAEAVVLGSVEPPRAMLLALLAGILVGTAPGGRQGLARVLLGLLD
jgi:hypothetical protein